MIDLTTAADFFRRSSFGIIIGIAGITVAILVYMNWGSIKNTVSKPKPPPATVAFGMLPKFNHDIGFPVKTGITYTIQTISGELPNLPSVAKVFALSKNEPTFGGPALVKHEATQLGFPAEPLETLGSKLTFIDDRNSSRQLVIDVLSGDLYLSTNYLTNPNILTTRPGSVDEVKSIAKDFFKSAGLAFEQYPETNVLTQNFRNDSGNLVEANSQANTNVIQVIYQHTDLDKLPVIAAKKGENNVNAIVSRNEVVEAKIVNMELSNNKFSTYPLKGVAKAFADLKAGRGNFDEEFSGEGATITSITIGYVEGDKEKGYLTPVYIFKMASGLNAYVDAVDEAWVNK